MTQFDQAEYWNNRVSGIAGLSAVGHRALGAAYNHWIYRRRLDALGAYLQTRSADNKVDSVLDLGCGSGFYEHYWREQEVSQLVGIDISPPNIDQLRLQFPEYQFFAEDIVHPRIHHVQKFQIVTLFDVLYHVIDDQDALQILRFVADNLDQFGKLILFDQILTRDYQLRTHVKFRGRDKLLLLLKQAGLQIESETPLFIALEPPMFGARLIDIPIAACYMLLGYGFRTFPRIGDMAGRLAYKFDTWALARSLRVPNHAMFIVRRTEQN